MTGEISSSLGNLTFLNTLDLSNNNFRGPVPPIRNMQQLQTFYLYNNFLDGTIPADAFTNCSNLGYLDLSINSLTGSVPQNIGFLPSLIFLRLDHNHLTSIGNFSALNKLGLQHKSMANSFPILFPISVLRSFVGKNRSNSRPKSPLKAWRFQTRIFRSPLVGKRLGAQSFNRMHFARAV